SRDDEPGSLWLIGFFDRQLVGFHVVIPLLAGRNIAGLKLPVLFRVVESFRESLVLFFRTDMKHDLQHEGSVAGKLFFKLSYGPVPAFEPGRRGEFLDPMHQYIFVVRAVEDPDFSMLWELAAYPPQEIVLLFFLRGLFEPNLPDALRVHRPDHMGDGTAFATGIHALQNQQY